MPAIVGREIDLASVLAFVDQSSETAAAFVLEGEAGIGKTTLWAAALEHAQTQGSCTLSSRPAEAERGLAYSGLGDLLEDVVDELLPSLSPPRRRALEVAMLREEASVAVDERAVAVAVRDVLQRLSETQRVLIAVDDVQWLDAASSHALAFALRRLGKNHILLLFTQRVGAGVQPSELESALAPDRVRHQLVGPLSVGALHQLLRDQFGRPFARQTLLRIHERSGGNPYFALELGRVIPDVDPFQPLPVPETLEALLRARIAGLPVSTRDALALVSALGTATESMLLRAGFVSEDLRPATAVGVIEREDNSIRFTHPLLSSLLYADLGDRRREIHARLAEHVEDPLLHARHLALSKDKPDEGIASVLDEAVKLAQDRGAAAVAAELAEYAVRLTPAEARDHRHRRALAAARAHQSAGEWTRARAIASEFLSETDAGSWRAEALVLLSELEGSDQAIELLEQALKEAAGRTALLSLIHCRLAWVTRFRTGIDHASAALELADQLDDPYLRARARAVQAILAWFAGTEKSPADLVQLAEHLPAALGVYRLVQEATQAIVNTLAPASVRNEGRAFFEREYSEWRDRDEARSARALWGLAWIEFWAGNWRQASENAVGAHDIAIQYGLEVPQDHLPIAVIAVHRGQLDVARTHSERALSLAMEQFGFHPPQHLAVLGLVALERGESAAALDWFDKAGKRAAALGWGEPSLRWWTSEHVELLLGLGRIDEAIALLDVWRKDATRVAREWVLAHATRCDGLVAAARNDVSGALTLLARAAAEHEAVGDPFGRARASLALGIVQRRARQKRAARNAFEAAASDFESIGASTWAARAGFELGRISGRRHVAGLSPSERRVAMLVAEGKTNREVAAELFLGERTVASHLTSIYAKLDVRSRTELARRMNEAELSSTAVKVQTF
ncbi:MAG TPA: AAA family ATPase [Candidatus Dormibacteraeota bacterium]|nr:AAA family ATPase [Candidatus Dormibacteraeota bacterium]